MPSRAGPWWAGLAVVLLAGTLAWPGLASEQGRKEELRDLRARIEQLRQEIEQAKEDHSDAADGLRASERRISDVNRTLLQLKRKEQSLARDLNALRQDSSNLRQELDQQESQLITLIRQRYVQGGADATLLMLSGRNPNQIARNLEYLAYIGRARADLIQGYRLNLDRMSQLESQTRQSMETLAGVRQERLDQKKSLEGEKAERKKVLDNLAARIATQRREVSVLKRNEQRLSRLIDRLSRLAAKPRPAPQPGPSTPGETVKQVPDASLAGYAFARLKGRLALPVTGEIAARFGQNREGGGPVWKGLFIRSAPGREVRAVGSGEVVFADWLRGFGNLLIIDHGSGFLSLYSNNESLYKQPGEPVRAGDVVASVGNTGGQEEPGLYFELRHQGKPFDPMTWVAR